MIGAILAIIGLIAGAALLVFGLHETGIVDRVPEQEDVVGGWTNYGKEDQ